MAYIEQLLTSLKFDLKNKKGFQDYLVSITSRLLTKVTLN